MAGSIAPGSIKRVGVIGAGTMGAGIAAQVANAGVPVVLLDIVPPGANNRNALAEGAVARMRKAEPAAFMYDGAAKLIDTGNLEDDLAKLSDCDWIVEAVLERTDIKQALYRKLEGVRRPGSAISSNTSTIGLKVLTEGMSEAFRRDFLITHFFNPPRYMRLLEIVAGPETDPGAVAASPSSPMSRWARASSGARTPRLHRQPARHLLDAGGGERGDRARPDGRGSGCHHRPPDGDSEDRRVRTDGPGRDRSEAAGECLDARGAAEVGRIPQRRSGTATDRPHDRARG